MLHKFSLRLALSILAVAATPAISNSSLAASGTGKVVVYHLNGTIPGRGACIQTSPGLSGGYACVWYYTQLYKSFEDILLQAYINGKTCLINWDETDSHGYGIIDLVQCQ